MDFSTISNMDGSDINICYLDADYMAAAFVDRSYADATFEESACAAAADTTAFEEYSPGSPEPNGNGDLLDLEMAHMSQDYFNKDLARSCAEAASYEPWYQQVEPDIFDNAFVFPASSSMSAEVPAAPMLFDMPPLPAFPNFLTYLESISQEIPAQFAPPNLFVEAGETHARTGSTASLAATFLTEGPSPIVPAEPPTRHSSPAIIMTKPAGKQILLPKTRIQDMDPSDAGAPRPAEKKGRAKRTTRADSSRVIDARVSKGAPKPKGKRTAMGRTLQSLDELRPLLLDEDMAAGISAQSDRQVSETPAERTLLRAANASQQQRRRSKRVVHLEQAVEIAQVVEGVPTATDVQVKADRLTVLAQSSPWRPAARARRAILDMSHGPPSSSNSRDMLEASPVPHYMALSRRMAVDQDAIPPARIPNPIAPSEIALPELQPAMQVLEERHELQPAQQVLEERHPANPPLELLTMLRTYLSATNPAPALCPATRLEVADISPSWWWDVRQVRQWSDFSPLAMNQYLGGVLDHQIPSICLAQVTIPTFPPPQRQTDLVTIFSHWIMPRLNAALNNAAVLMVMRNGKASELADFASRAPTTSSRNANVIGLVREWSHWNISLRTGSRPQMLDYLRGLADLQAAMRQGSTRYGYLLNETELCVVRNGTESIPHFGYFELATFPLSIASTNPTSQAPVMTAMQALFYLHDLASQIVPPGASHWYSYIGSLGEVTRRNVSDEPIDEWIPDDMQLVNEQRHCKRARGWVWPQDKSAPEERRDAKRVHYATNRAA